MSARQIVAMAVCLLSLRSAFGQGSAENGDADRKHYECSSLLTSLRQKLAEEEAHRIVLRRPARADRPESDEPQACEHVERAARALDGGVRTHAELGRLGDQRAALLRDGPQGSGHFWDLTLVVEIEGRTLGTCMTASTPGWRNLPPQSHHLFGRWRALSGGRLQIWSSLDAGAAEIESLLLPIVYRLSHRALVVDRAATAAEIAGFGRLYGRVAAMGDDDARDLHQAAADAYRAFAGGQDCPQR